MYRVEVVAFIDGDVVKSIKCSNQREADRVDAGLNINLNHEKYFTQITETSDERD